MIQTAPESDHSGNEDETMSIFKNIQSDEELFPSGDDDEHEEDDNQENENEQTHSNEDQENIRPQPNCAEHGHKRSKVKQGLLGTTISNFSHLNDLTNVSRCDFDEVRFKAPTETSISNLVISIVHYKVFEPQYICI